MSTLLVFDFDCTIVDCDTDPWVVDQLGASDLMNSLRTYLPWNDMMDTMMAALHAQGRTITDIEESLKTVPLQQEKITAIKAAHALGCELRIVSDANTFFINTILDKYNLREYFTEIHTNPACIDERNALRIFPFHSKSEPPHDCPLCPPNMCKGRIIDSIRTAFPADERKNIIYVGDGCGDYCPSLRLGTGDCVFPREGFPLRELLHENASQVKADVHAWNSAKDLEDILLELLKSKNKELV